MVKENAEDLFQEIMLKVFQNLSTYNPMYSFNTWIYTIARNHCVNYITKRKLLTVDIENKSLKGLTPVQTNTPANETLDKELYRVIEKIIAQFNEGKRQVAFLYFFEGMKNREIAQILNIPTGTIKSRIHNIRITLEKELESYHEY